MAWVRSHHRAMAELGVTTVYRSSGLLEEDRYIQFLSHVNSLVVGAAEAVDTGFCVTT